MISKEKAKNIPTEWINDDREMILKCDYEEMLDKIYDSLEEDLEFYDVTDELGYLQGFPQLGKFKKNTQVSLYSIEEEK